MGITKRPKKVNIGIYDRCITYTTCFNCPSCNTMFVPGPDKNVISFRCNHCGQVLIVGERKG